MRRLCHILNPTSYSTAVKVRVRQRFSMALRRGSGRQSQRSGIGEAGGAHSPSEGALCLQSRPLPPNPKHTAVCYMTCCIVCSV